MNSQPDRSPSDDPEESVAGEEDPGASLDVPGPGNPNSTAADVPVSPVNEPFPDSGAAASPASGLLRGDEVAAGTPGSAEGICRTCGGSGWVQGSTCPDCAGAGEVTVGVG